ncbi:hypothetical protein UPYG_G00103480, partial [Umbra pygmaea]
MIHIPPACPGYLLGTRLLLPAGAEKSILNQLFRFCELIFPSDKQRHFDKSGQTVRLRQGATPSIFKFPDHLSKQPSSSRLSRTSNRAIEESPHTWSNTPVRGTPALFDQPISDHQYALDPVKAKEKLAVSQENVEKLRRDLRNAKDRERRQ